MSERIHVVEFAFGGAIHKLSLERARGVRAELDTAIRLAGDNAAEAADRALLAQMAATIYASRDGSNVERTAAISVAAARAILAEIDKEPTR